MDLDQRQVKKSDRDQEVISPGMVGCWRRTLHRSAECEISGWNWADWCRQGCFLGSWPPGPRLNRQTAGAPVRHRWSVTETVCSFTWTPAAPSLIARWAGSWLCPWCLTSVLSLTVDEIHQGHPLLPPRPLDLDVLQVSYSWELQGICPINLKYCTSTASHVLFIRFLSQHEVHFMATGLHPSSNSPQSFLTLFWKYRH